MFLRVFQSLHGGSLQITQAVPLLQSKPGFMNGLYTFCTIYVRKSPEKKFLEKNLELKTLEKKSQFCEVLGQNVIGNRVLSFRFLGLFSLK